MMPALSLFVFTSLLWGLVESSYPVQVLPQARKEVFNRPGCREVLSCTGFETHPRWNKAGLYSDVDGGERLLTNSTSNGVRLFSADIIFDPLQRTDTGLYTCSIFTGGSAQRSIALTLIVDEERLEIRPIDNIILSRYSNGHEITISCFVETCIQDVVVQIFKDDQLLETETYPSGNQLVTSAQVKVTEKLAGRYACQAMSEIENLVRREFFSATGTPQR